MESQAAEDEDDEEFALDEASQSASPSKKSTVEEGGVKRKRGRPRAKKTVSQTVSFTPSRHVTIQLSWDQLRELMDLVHEKVQASTDDDGRYRCDIFLELPSREDYPDYYEAIKNPLCLNEIVEKINSEAYQNLAQFVSEYDLIFQNAMTYNVEGSLVYEDALFLKQLVHDTIDSYVAENKSMDSEQN